VIETFRRRVISTLSAIVPPGVQAGEGRVIGGESARPQLDPCEVDSRTLFVYRTPRLVVRQKAIGGRDQSAAGVDVRVEPAISAVEVAIAAGFRGPAPEGAFGGRSRTQLRRALGSRRNGSGGLRPRDGNSDGAHRRGGEGRRRFRARPAHWGGGQAPMTEGEISAARAAREAARATKEPRRSLTTVNIPARYRAEGRPEGAGRSPWNAKGYAGP
jgi:hypothetical protein